MIGMAYAQGAAGSQGGDTLVGLLPIILMFVVMYFIMIRPQMKKAKEHKTMLEAIQKPLKARGYSHTVIIDRRSTYYNERAISVDVIWSRRGENEREIERRAVHFEIRNRDGENRIISIAACHTPESRLDAVFSYDFSDERYG